MLTCSLQIKTLESGSQGHKLIMHKVRPHFIFPKLVLPAYSEQPLRLMELASSISNVVISASSPTPCTHHPVEKSTVQLDSNYAIPKASHFVPCRCPLCRIGTTQQSVQKCALCHDNSKPKATVV